MFNYAKRVDAGLVSGVQLPGAGPVVWVARLVSCVPAYGSAVASKYPSRGCLGPSAVSKALSQLMRNKKSSAVIMMSTPENGVTCNPNHLMDWLGLFNGLEERVYLMAMGVEYVNKVVKRLHICMTVGDLKKAIQNKVPVLTSNR